MQVARMKSRFGAVRRRALPRPDHPGHRRHHQDHRPHRRADPRAAARGERASSREPIPASELKVALECGGSDGFSGITANPALGVASDLLVGLGGTAILAETPGDLRRRAAPPAPRRQPGGRREAHRAHPLVGALHRDQRRLDGQQPLARQQGRRPDHHPGEVARRRRQGRLDAADRRLPVRRAGDDARLRLHGHPRLRPGRRPPARSPAARRSWSSPPAAARPSAPSRRRRSRSPPTTGSTRRCPTTWTSTAATSSARA